MIDIIHSIQTNTTMEKEDMESTEISIEDGETYSIKDNYISVLPSHVEVLKTIFVKAGVACDASLIHSESTAGRPGKAFLHILVRQLDNSVSEFCRTHRDDLKKKGITFKSLVLIGLDFDNNTDHKVEHEIREVEGTKCFVFHVNDEQRLWGCEHNHSKYTRLGHMLRNEYKFDADKPFLETVDPNEYIVNVEVGTDKFKTLLSTIQECEKMMEALRLKGEDCTLFIDGEHEIYKHIFNFLRYKSRKRDTNTFIKTLPDKPHVLERILQEAMHWGLKEAEDGINTCIKQLEQNSGQGRTYFHGRTLSETLQGFCPRPSFKCTVSQPHL